MDNVKLNNEDSANTPSINELSNKGISKFGTSFLTSRPLMEQNIKAGLPVITAAGWLSCAAGAQLGYLLNAILSRNSEAIHRYTLFANSTIEATYAVIRLCRQKSRQNRSSDAHKVLIFDPKEQFASFFDPLGEGPMNALCPQVHCVETAAAFMELAEKHRMEWACIIVINSTGVPVDAKMQELIEHLAEETGSVRVVVNSELPLFDPLMFTAPKGTDIIIFGENLTNHEVPFACFSLSDDVYEVWNNRQSLATYTSTFYGNSTSLMVALETLRALKAHQLTDDDQTILAEIADDFQVRFEYFIRYVHPVYGQLFNSDKSDLRIVHAKGVHLSLANGNTVMDMSSLGCSLRGHNPKEALEAIMNYDPEKDYIAELTVQLRQLTHYSHILPSVSGGGAVDNAIAIALLANAPRRKIISLCGNFSGKTLPSVNFSRTAPLLADRDQGAFEPYYPDVIYINPFAEDASSQFIEAVKGDDISIVWFELIQGYMFKALPTPIVELVEANKERFGYLIGVDEVLTGMFKNGRSLLFQQGKMMKVDVSTLSKATSDMVFPVSFTLVTDHVYRRAMAAKPRSVLKMGSTYRNNLGAAIALHAIRDALHALQGGQLALDNQAFHRELRKLVSSSPLFEGITCEESLVRLNINKGRFPYRDGSIESTLVEGAISKLLFRSSGVLFTNLRIFLPALHTSEIRQELLNRLRSGLECVTLESVCEYILDHDHDILALLGITANFENAVLMPSE